MRIFAISLWQIVVASPSVRSGIGSLIGIRIQILEARRGDTLRRR